MAKHKKRIEIEKIIDNMKCNRNFACYKSGFKNAKDVSLESFVECSHKRHAWQCDYSFIFGAAYLCKCPFRVYVIKRLKK